nr:CoA ester lyase [uncultured Cohaesibacter sp.]
MRSYLFVPGDSPRKMEKALSAGADVILIDLEDSVSLSQKQTARDLTATFLKEQIPTRDRPRIYVRVNALDTELTDNDLDAVVPHRPDGIMLPKSQSGKSITALDVKIRTAEAVAGIPLDQIKIMAVATETASAIFNLGTYGGSSPRLTALTWGAEDLSADLGAERNRDEDGAFTSPFRLVRDLCLMGAVAAEVAPVDGVFINYRDTDGLRQECLEARRDGFVGKMAIHPAQVAIINEVFTPDEAAIEKASRIVESFSQAGDVGVVGIDGEMIDRPHLRRAETTLRRAGLLK